MKKVCRLRIRKYIYLIINWLNLTQPIMSSTNIWLSWNILPRYNKLITNCPLKTKEFMLHRIVIKMLQTCVLGSLKILASGGVILASIESVRLQLWSFFFDESKLDWFFGLNKTDLFLKFSGLFVILASIASVCLRLWSFLFGW